MTLPRRFSDDEVQRILEQASRAQGPGGDTELAERAPGLTLAELQAIGAEAGIDPAAIARAAQLEASGAFVPAVVQHAGGAPIAVAKVIELGQEIDDATWQRIVLLLREVFGARGRMRFEGGMREWSNGNLLATLEATPQGHRLRVSTRKGDAQAFRVLGNLGLLAAAVVGATVSIPLAQSGVDVAPWWLPLTLGLAGVGAHLRNFLVLRQWGRVRAAQMDALPERLRDLLPPER